MKINSSLPLISDTNLFFIASTNGHYAVTLNQNGCTDTSACYTITGVGINEINSQSNFDIFPNPATNQFTIELKDYNKPAKITIRDIAGKDIYTITVGDKRSHEINTKYFVEGIYTVEFKRDDFIETKKLIITK